MQMDLGYIFPRIAAGRLHHHGHALIDHAAFMPGVPVHHQVALKYLRCRLRGEDRAKQFFRLGAADPDDRDAALPRRGRDCRDGGVVHTALRYRLSIPYEFPSDNRICNRTVNDI